MAAQRELILPTQFQISNRHSTPSSFKSKSLFEASPLAIIDLLLDSKIISATYGPVDPKLVALVSSWFGRNLNDPASLMPIDPNLIHVQAVTFNNPSRIGIHYLGTNFIAISSSSLSNDDLTQYALCHELNHLVSCLFGGVAYSLPDSVFDLPLPEWVDEGLTEKMTRDMVSANLGQHRAARVFSNHFDQLPIIQGIEFTVGAEVLLRSSRTKNLVEVFTSIDDVFGYEFSRELLLGYNYPREILAQRATLK